MTAQHTPGPWRAEKVDHRDSDDYEIRAESGALIAETFELIGKHRETVNQHENARRIVACVNACAGIPNGNLEAGGVFETIKAERDELLAALKDAREMVDNWGVYASPYFQEKWNLLGDLAKLDAAIAKAERPRAETE